MTCITKRRASQITHFRSISLVHYPCSTPMNKSKYLPKLKPSLPKSPVFKERFYKKQLVNGHELTNPVNPQNPFLQLLASPLRQDRTRRNIVTPRELLVKYQIIRDPNDQLWMSPDVKGVLPNSSIGSTYLVNRNASLKYPKVANLNLLKENIVYDKVKDVKWNEDNSKIIDEHYQEILREELNKVEVDEEYEGVEIAIHLKNVANIPSIGFDKKENNVVFNFSKFERKTPGFYKEVKEYLKGGDCLVLKFSQKNSKFLTTFIRFYLYNFKN